MELKTLRYFYHDPSVRAKGQTRAAVIEGVNNWMNFEKWYSPPRESVAKLGIRSLLKLRTELQASDIPLLCRF